MSEREKGKKQESSIVNVGNDRMDVKYVYAI